jgi:energy-coupling factor transport system ATP-binding protein
MPSLTGLTFRSPQFSSIQADTLQRLSSFGRDASRRARPGVNEKMVNDNPPRIEPLRTPSRTVAQAVVLVAIGVALAPYTSFPIGIAKINPTQHFVNLFAAVLLGPWWAIVIAFAIGVLRNAMGVGTLLAFPGGMIGAFLAGYLYRRKARLAFAAAGEILGTGFIAPVASALLVAPFLMGTAIPLLALIPSFLGSTVAGTILGIVALTFLQRADIVHLES